MNTFVYILLGCIYVVAGYSIGWSQATDYWKLTELYQHPEPSIITYSYGPYTVITAAPGVKLECHTR